MGRRQAWSLRSGGPCGPHRIAFSKPRGSGTRNIVEKNQWMAIVGTTAGRTTGKGRNPKPEEQCKQEHRGDRNEADRVGSKDIGKQKRQSQKKTRYPPGITRP